MARGGALLAQTVLAPKQRKAVLSLWNSPKHTPFRHITKERIKERVIVAFCIEHINVRQGKIDFEVSCSASCLYVDKELAARMLEAFPNLQNHVCVNKKGDTFGADIIDTELPHLFEHLTIELLAQKFPAEASCGVFSGYTTWLQKPLGSNKVSSFGVFAKILPKNFLRKKEARRAQAYMLVTLSYIKEQDCIDAAKKSEELINNFLSEHHTGK